jgi:hypothetical protein
VVNHWKAGLLVDDEKVLIDAEVMEWNMASVNMNDG